MYSENFDLLKKTSKYNAEENRLEFRPNNKASMLPITSREPERVDFKKGFRPIIGALTRLTFNKNIESFNPDEIIENIFDNEDFECESQDEKDTIISLINSYLDISNVVNVSHPKLLLFLPLSDDEERKGEMKLANFLDQIFFRDLDFKSFFIENDEESYNVLLEFITSNMNELNEDGNNSTEKYSISPAMNDVISIFKEDFEFLLKHKSFLLDNLDLFLAYYYYLYIVRFSIRANNDNSEMNPLYWLLDDEVLSKNRKAIKSGYNKIGGALNNLWVNLNLIEELNILSGTNNLLPFESVEYYFNNLNNEEKKEFLIYFKDWISKLRKVKKLEYENLESYDMPKLVKILRDSIKQSYKNSPAAESRVKKGFENLGKKYFIKRRGRYGYILNINRDLLNLITVLSIKDNEKISTVDLFKEFERRGLFLDEISENEVIELYNKLNLIDNKSDSGEVKYVKSIL